MALAAVLVALLFGVLPFVPLARVLVRKRRTVRLIRAEGAAARRRIARIAAGLLPEPSPWERLARPAALLAAGVTAVVMIPSARIVDEDRMRAAAADGYRRLLAVLEPGDCVNFTADTPDVTAPISRRTPCADAAATFRVLWVGTTQSPSRCTGSGDVAREWWYSADGSACTTRVYHAGQCMRGRMTSREHAFAWDDTAVVPCSRNPTARFPYLVRVVAVVARPWGACPAGSGVGDISARGAPPYACVRLVRRLAG